MHVCFRDDKQRNDVGVIGSNEGAVYEAGTRFGINRRGDDAQLVGICHQHPLYRIGVIRGAAQHTHSFAASHNAREIAVGANDVDQVTHREALTAKFASLDGEMHLSILELDGESAAIHGQYSR